MAAYDLIDVELKDLHLDDVLFNPYCYEQGLIKVIEQNGKVYTMPNAGEVEAYYKVGTIKIEGMEKFSEHVWIQLNRLCHYGPITCHVFIANENSPSFPDHVDLDDVVLFVVDGEKTIFMNGEEFVLGKGQCVNIPAGTPHHAINRKASVMLSIGFEKFILEKLHA